MDKWHLVVCKNLGKQARCRCPIVLLALSFGQGKCWLSDKGGCDGVTLALWRLTGVTTTSDPRGGRTRLSPLSICSSHTSQCTSSALLSKAHIGKSGTPLWLGGSWPLSLVWWEKLWLGWPLGQWQAGHPRAALPLSRSIEGPTLLCNALLCNVVAFCLPEDSYIFTVQDIIQFCPTTLSPLSKLILSHF